MDKEERARLQALYRHYRDHAPTYENPNNVLRCSTCFTFALEKLLMPVKLIEEKKLFDFWHNTGVDN